MHDEIDGKSDPRVEKLMLRSYLGIIASCLVFLSAMQLSNTVHQNREAEAGCIRNTSTRVITEVPIPQYLPVLPEVTVVATKE